MGMASGSATLNVYYGGAVDAAEDLLNAGLSKIVPLDRPGRTSGYSSGWVDPSNIYNAEPEILAIKDVSTGGMYLKYRVDEVKVDASQVGLAVNKRIREYEGKVSKEIGSIIKDEEFQKRSLATPVTTKFYDVVLTATGTLLVFAGKEDLSNYIAESVSDVLAVPLVRLSAPLWLAKSMSTKEMLKLVFDSSDAGKLPPGSDQILVSFCNSFGKQFLLWLMNKAKGDQDSGCEVALGSKIELVSNLTPTVVSIKDEDLWECPEVLESLNGGRIPKKVEVVLAKHDRVDYKWRFVFDGEDFKIGAISLLALDRSEGDEAGTWLRIDALEVFLSTLLSLFGQFVRCKIDKKLAASYLEELTAWYALPESFEIL